MSPTPTPSLTNSDAPSKRPPTPAKDLEYGRPSRPTTQQTHHTQPSHQPSSHALRSSHSSRRTSTSTSTTTPHASLPPTGIPDPDPASLPFNPSHPCYPHPNPHVPLSSPLYSSTRIIRIPRDWELAGDLAPTFSEVYPEILAPWVSEASFRELVNGVNERLIEVYAPGGRVGGGGVGGGVGGGGGGGENGMGEGERKGGNVGIYGWRQWLDVIAGIMSGWITEDLGLTGVKAGLKEVEAFVERWNGERRRDAQIGSGIGIGGGGIGIGGGGVGGGMGEKGEDEDSEVAKCIPLRRTGYLSLDIQVPDPNLERVGGSEVEGSMNGEDHKE